MKIQYEEKITDYELLKWISCCLSAPSQCSESLIVVQPLTDLCPGQSQPQTQRRDSSSLRDELWQQRSCDNTRECAHPWVVHLFESLSCLQTAACSYRQLSVVLYQEEHFNKHFSIAKLKISEKDDWNNNSCWNYFVTLNFNLQRLAFLHAKPMTSSLFTENGIFKNCRYMKSQME